jgi:hypothetical protein
MDSGLGPSSSTQKLGVSILNWKGTEAPTQLVPTEESLSSLNENDSFYSTRLNMWLPIILPENRTDPFPGTLWSFHKMLDNRQSQEQINPNTQFQCLSDHRQWAPMMTVFSCYDCHIRRDIDSSGRTSPYFTVTCRKHGKCGRTKR